MDPERHISGSLCEKESTISYYISMDTKKLIQQAKKTNPNFTSWTYYEGAEIFVIDNDNGTNTSFKVSPTGRLTKPYTYSSEPTEEEKKMARLAKRMAQKFRT